MEDSILTVEQVAHILQVHPFTVLKFIKQGKLNAAKLGRVYRIRRTEVESFLDQQMGHNNGSPSNPGKKVEQGTLTKSTEQAESAQPKKPKKSAAQILSPKEATFDSRLTVESKAEDMSDKIITKKAEHRSEPKPESHTRNQSDHYIIKVNF